MPKFSSTVALLAIAFVLDANQHAWSQHQWWARDNRTQATTTQGGGASLLITISNSAPSSATTSGTSSSTAASGIMPADRIFPWRSRPDVEGRHSKSHSDLCCAGRRQQPDGDSSGA